MLGPCVSRLVRVHKISVDRPRPFAARRAPARSHNCRALKDSLYNSSDSNNLVLRKMKCGNIYSFIGLSFVSLLPLLPAVVGAAGPTILSPFWSCLSLDRGVVLSFDDGPSPFTDALLDTLKIYEVKAGGFVNILLHRPLASVQGLNSFFCSL